MSNVTVAAHDALQKDRIRIPVICVCLYFLCMPLTFVTVVPGVSMLRLVTIPVVGVLACSLFLGKSRISFNVVHFTYCLYMILCAASLLIFRSEESIVTVRDMFLTFAVMMLATLQVYNRREKNLIVYTWILVGLISALMCVTSHNTIYGERTVIVILGSREDPNQFCSYFILPVLFALEKLVEGKNKWRFLTLPYIALIAYAVLRTGSRGGLAALAVGIVVYVLIGLKSIKAKIAVIITSMLVVILTFTLVVPNLPETVRERYTLERITSDRGSGRYDIWEYLIRYIADDEESLLCGYGICSTTEVMAEANFTNRYAHNQWIQVLFDQGILGVVFYALMILSCMMRSWKRSSVCLCAVVSIMAFSMSLTFYTFKPYFNIIMMCAMNYDGELALHRLAEKLRKGKESVYAQETVHN
ncbi:MAG: O-antigen ligase family protein [Clostridia bacterium]|nr:O-antigen ligase family protein [Clostridia bacterium]